MTERAQDLTWNGLPVYRCRWCGPAFERVNRLHIVLEHEAKAHAQPEPVTRESLILDPSGAPFQVAQEATQ